jgi:hypothetical protein
LFDTFSKALTEMAEIEKKGSSVMSSELRKERIFHTAVCPQPLIILPGLP